MSELTVLYQDRKSTCCWSSGQKMIISSKSAHNRSILTLTAWTISASSAFVKSCMIQNKWQREHRRDVLHVRRNHGITAIGILRRIGMPLGEIFIFLLLKNTALLPISVEWTRFRWCSFRHIYGQFNQSHPFTTFRYGIRPKSRCPWLCSQSHPVYLGADI